MFRNVIFFTDKSIYFFLHIYRMRLFLLLIFIIFFFFHRHLLLCTVFFERTQQNHKLVTKFARHLDEREFDFVSENARTKCLFFCFFLEKKKKPPKTKRFGHAFTITSYRSINSPKSDVKKK